MRGRERSSAVRPDGASGSWKRILRWWIACWRQAIARDLQFRTQTAVIALSAVVDVGIALVPALVLTQTARTSAAGWDEATAVLVVGLFTIATAALDTVVGPNLQRLDAAVRTGEVDLLLVRPIPAFLSLTLRWVRPAETTRLLTGGALVGAALLLGEGMPTLGGIAACLLLLALGAGAWFLFWVNVSLLSFWWSSAAPVQDIIGGLREAGQYPLAAFRRGTLLGLSTLVPALLLGAVPAGVLLGGDLARPLLVASVVILGGAALTAAHWRRALRRYESASS